MALPDLSDVPARLSAWLQRPAAPLPQIPHPTPRAIPAAVQAPLPALSPILPDHRSGGRGRRPGGKPRAPLSSASAVPAPRTLAADVFVPRSTALEDTRKVLQLMESALQDAAYAVVAAQEDTARRR